MSWPAHESSKVSKRHNRHRSAGKTHLDNHRASQANNHLLAEHLAVDDELPRSVEHADEVIEGE